MTSGVQARYPRIPAKLATGTVTAVALCVLLSGCMSPVIEAPRPAPREEPINSLALEQCIGENGAERCASGE
jgi:hypothetical protein